jgi:hypothetical protein
VLAVLAQETSCGSYFDVPAEHHSSYFIPYKLNGFSQYLVILLLISVLIAESLYMEEISSLALNRDVVLPRLLRL